jgi:hypothetical protein
MASQKDLKHAVAVFIGICVSSCCACPLRILASEFFGSSISVTARIERVNPMLVGKEMVRIIPEIELGSLWLDKQGSRRATAVFVGCRYTGSSTHQPRILAPAFFGSGYSVKAFPWHQLLLDMLQQQIQTQA